MMKTTDLLLQSIFSNCPFFLDDSISELEYAYYMNGGVLLRTNNSVQVPSILLIDQQTLLVDLYNDFPGNYPSFSLLNSQTDDNLFK